MALNSLESVQRLLILPEGLDFIMVCINDAHEACKTTPDDISLETKVMSLSFSGLSKRAVTIFTFLPRGAKGRKAFDKFFYKVSYRLMRKGLKEFKKGTFIAELEDGRYEEVRMLFTAREIKTLKKLKS